MRSVFYTCLILANSYIACGQKADSLLLKTHVYALVGNNAFRTYTDTAELNRVAAYIYTTFKVYSQSVTEQKYTVGKYTYKNIVCSFGPENAERIVVGAHYDVCGNQQGADDNASGTAGLLELARLLKDKTLEYRIDLVAYTLEEPPFFRTTEMGSFKHAEYLHTNNIAVKGMVCLEMIGYFSDAKKSQDYPLKLLRVFYGNKGNYITVVQKFGAGKFARKFKRLFKKQNLMRTKSFKAPKFLPGIDFSDHLNYWHFGYSAVMITNTAFYRNKNYHEAEDTAEKLDYRRMGLVVDEVYNTLLGLKKRTN